MTPLAIPAPIEMPDDTPLFLGCIALLIIYLSWSAWTEMGTRWPWKK